jgi:hypothetical protein
MIGKWVPQDSIVLFAGRNASQNTIENKLE